MADEARSSVAEPPNPATTPDAGRSKTVAAALGLAIVLIWFGFSFPSSIARLNDSIIDAQIGWLPRAELSSLPVIVEVDEKSLSAHGQWPWPRYRVAELLEAIRRTGPAAVGVDALFVEPDRSSPLEIQRAVETELKQRLPLGGIDRSLWDYDEVLRRQLQTGPFVLSYMFGFGPDDGAGESPCRPGSASISWLGKPGESGFDRVYRADRVLCNVPAVQAGAAASGFINTAPDRDGLYRKTPVVIRHGDRFYPSLALQTYLTATQAATLVLTADSAGLALRIGERNVPLDAAGNLRVKFPHPEQSFQKISAADLLAGKWAVGSLAHRIVLVGFSAAGLHEFRPTPYAPKFLGVEFHAAIVDNLARNDFLQRPDFLPATEWALAVSIAVALLAGLRNAGIVASIATPCLLSLALIVLSQLLLRRSGLVFSPALPVATTLAVLVAVTFGGYIREFLRAKRLAEQVAITHEGIIGSFCTMSEYRDPETGAHIKRTQLYVKALARRLRHHPDFRAALNDETIELLYKAAPLHDIGKIGIRDHILLKNDRLEDGEFEIMKSHPQIGADIIRSVAGQIGWNDFMRVAHEICLYHQEKWDGSGYPQGLAGDAIPVSARFMALADVYDALISKRVYKPAFSHARAVALISAGQGKHFDPRLVEAFEAIQEQFRDIALSNLDDDAQRATLLAEEPQPGNSRTLESV